MSGQPTALPTRTKERDRAFAVMIPALMAAGQLEQARQMATDAVQAAEGIHDLQEQAHAPTKLAEPRRLNTRVDQSGK